MRIERTVCVTLVLLAGAGGCSRGSPSGGSTQQGIIGGVSDTWHSYVVGVDNAADNLDCSGTLISRRTVITAAHCPSPTRVFFGPNVLASASPARTEIAVLQRVEHPAFSGSPNYFNDLALLQLASDAPAQPAPLLRETLTNTAGTFTTTTSAVGPGYTTVGYGYTGVGANDYGRRHAAVFAVNTVGAASFSDGTDSFAVDASQFFYKSVGKNQCAGDSGGATFLVRDHTERLAGVISLGDAKCEVGFDARADAPQIAAFIQATIDSFEPGNDCRADGVCKESCNTAGVIVDPDCADAHCKADGICAIACVLPADPDCPSDGHCATDGICDKNCNPFDQDCLPACGADGVCLLDCPTADPDCAMDMSVVDLTVLPDLSSVDGGVGMDAGCAFAHSARAANTAWLFVALALLLLARRRRVAASAKISRRH